MAKFIVFHKKTEERTGTRQELSKNFQKKLIFNLATKIAYFYERFILPDLMKPHVSSKDFLHIY